MLINLLQIINALSILGEAIDAYIFKDISNTLFLLRRLSTNMNTYFILFK